jgi:hypothetical protein
MSNQSRINQSISIILGKLFKSSQSFQVVSNVNLLIIVRRDRWLQRVSDGRTDGRTGGRGRTLLANT